MTNYFNESTAQKLWRAGRVDDCIVYSMCCIPPTMASARLKYPCATQWDDLKSEYQLYLVLAIQRYDPTKGTKLFTWINLYLWGAESHFIRREVPYCQKNVQFPGGSCP
jgi:hypothetical protein